MTIKEIIEQHPSIRLLKADVSSLVRSVEDYVRNSLDDTIKEGLKNCITLDEHNKILTDTYIHLDAHNKIIDKEVDTLYMSRRIKFWSDAFLCVFPSHQYTIGYLIKLSDEALKEFDERWKP